MADAMGEATTGQSPTPTGMRAVQLIEGHQRLEDAIAEQLTIVTEDTESAAAVLITRVRRLNDAARELLAMLGDSNASATAIGRDIDSSAQCIAEIGTFLQHLPTLIREDVDTIQLAAIREIDSLAGFTRLIKDISDQTNMLAINAAIVAATAGDAGRGFEVIAGQVRALSLKSAEAAAMIHDGLTKAEHSLKQGLRDSPINQRIAAAEATVASLHTLQASYDRMRSYYRSLVGVITEHNTTLATEIAEMLGHIQFQDVVRQRLERAMDAAARRNDLLLRFADGLALDRTLSGDLPLEMDAILDEYEALEARHATVGSDETAAPRIELF